MTPGKGGGEDRGAVGGPAGRRALNRAVLLRALRRSGPTTRQELARHSGLSLTTVASLAAELEAAGLVVQRPVVHGGSGRRPFLVAFNRAAGTALSLDIGSRHVAAAVGNRTRPVIVEHRIDLPSPHHDPRAVEHLAVTCAERVLAEAQAGPEVLLGAAVAVARTVPRDRHPPRGGSGTGRAPDLARAAGAALADPGSRREPGPHGRTRRVLQG
ncbi:MarR family transcriptional regulator [Kitasatospora camelliae]|uniref:MarR family transcriptional regulator n=1 Tax=Kitasatospora camelliae TaxID=3156397 RepID=A0AAU8K8R4_9ACTN